MSRLPAPLPSSLLLPSSRNASAADTSLMTPRFTFIDLFAGIGGFHIALENLGGECVFASEWNKYARETYEHNFTASNPRLFAEDLYAGDITKVTTAESPEESVKQIDSRIPDFTILTGGFPCQPFSHAGHKRGFADERGNLFFHIRDIIAVKQPAAFFLENVAGLLKHDNGHTFATIQRIITEELGYSFHYKMVRASDYGLPQHRPRLYMVGFRDASTPFEFPQPTELTLTMSDILGAPCKKKIGYTLRVGGRGSLFGDRHNWEFYPMEDGTIRRLTVKEGTAMMGFPADYAFPVSETQAFKQLGNAVAVPAIQATAEQILASLRL